MFQNFAGHKSFIIKLKGKGEGNIDSTKPKFVIQSIICEKV